MYTINSKRYPTVTETRICGFFQEYRFLSNFYKCLKFEWLGYEFDNTEAAYMASKSTDRHVHKLFSTLAPNVARNIGQSIIIRPDWNDVRLDVMMNVNRLKYNDPVLRKLLDDTGNKILVETNTWGDFFWGASVDGVGENNLGKILMRIRDESIF